MKLTKPNRSKASRGGFTLLEMMLVFGLIALLMGAGAYTMVNVLAGGRIDRAAMDLGSLETALIAYQNRALLFPTTEQGLQALVERPTSPPVPKRWIAGLKPTSLLDPFGNPYQFRNPPTNNSDKPDIWSWGPDGQEGTADDIVNWE
jgi:general secretion pathway protein G